MRNCVVDVQMGVDQSVKREGDVVLIEISRIKVFDEVKSKIS
jgi:hypothetical protein